MKKARQLIFVIGLLIFCIIGGLMQVEATTVEVRLQEYTSSQRVVEVRVQKMMYYNPTQEELEFLHKLVYAEAGNEDLLGKIIVANVVINDMYERDFEDLFEEITYPGRYSTVVDGKVYIIYTDKSGNKVQQLVTDEMVTQEVKDAVELALEKEYSEELLKQEAEALGINDPKYYEGGALYFCSPGALSEERSNERMHIKVTYKHGSHAIYRFWDRSG